MGKMHTFSSCKIFSLQKLFEIVSIHIVKVNGITYVCLANSSFINCSIALRHQAGLSTTSILPAVSGSGWITMPQRIKARFNISVLQCRLTYFSKGNLFWSTWNAFFNCISSKCLAEDDWKCFMKSLSFIMN